MASIFGRDCLRDPDYHRNDGRSSFCIQRRRRSPAQGGFESIRPLPQYELAPSCTSRELRLLTVTGQAIGGQTRFHGIESERADQRNDAQECREVLERTSFGRLGCSQAACCWLSAPRSTVTGIFISRQVGTLSASVLRTSTEEPNSVP